MATDKMTKKNFAFDACNSRHAIRLATDHGNAGLDAVVILDLHPSLVRENHSIAQYDAAIRTVGNGWIVSYKYQRGCRVTISVEE